jgi:hypothetical protein
VVVSANPVASTPAASAVADHPLRLTLRRPGRTFLAQWGGAREA